MGSPRIKTEIERCKSSIKECCQFMDNLKFKVLKVLPYQEELFCIFFYDNSGYSIREFYETDRSDHLGRIVYGWDEDEEWNSDGESDTCRGTYHYFEPYIFVAKMGSFKENLLSEDFGDTSVIGENTLFYMLSSGESHFIEGIEKFKQYLFTRVNDRIKQYEEFVRYNQRSYKTRAKKLKERTLREQKLRTLSEVLEGIEI